MSASTDAATSLPLWAEPDVRRYCTGCGSRHELGVPRRCCPDTNPVDAHAYIEHLEPRYRRDVHVVIAALRWASFRRRLRSGDLCRGPGSTAVDSELFDAVQEQRVRAEMMPA